MPVAQVFRAWSAIKSGFLVSTPATNLAQHEQVEALYLLTCPWRFAQKLQAGIDAGVQSKTAYGDKYCQLGPAVVPGQLFHNGLQSFAVQGVVRLLSGVGGRWRRHLRKKRGGDEP